MPKVPQVFSSGDVGGAGLVRASPALADVSGLSALSQAAQTFFKADKKVANEAAKLEAEMALGEVQRQFADADIKLKSDPNVTPDDYPKQVDEALRNIRQGVGRTVQHPEARMDFERATTKFAASKSVEGKYEGLAMRISEMKANTDTLLRADENFAITANEPEAQAVAEQRGLNRIENLRALRVLSGDEANTKKAAFLANVSEGRMLRELQNPMLRPTVINRLAKGEYEHMPADYQLKKARELATQFTAEQRLAEAKAEKDMKFGADVFVARVIDSYSTGKTEDRMDRAAVRRGLEQFAGHVSPETQRSLITMVEKPELEGGVTNPEVFNHHRIRILLNPTGTSPDSVLREGPDRLSAKDKGDLLKMLQTASKEDDVSQSVPYKKGREQIMILLGGVPTGLPEFLGLPILKPAESATLARTLFEFDKRARTEAYLREPEKLLQLGRDMALTARGGPPRPVGAPGQAPALPPSTGAPGAPKVDLPKMGDAPKGSKKAVPR